MNVQDDVRKVLAFVQQDLMNAIKWAITSLYSDGSAPDRVYMRDAQGTAMSILSDPCQAFGLNALIRPNDFQRLENFGG